MEILLACLQMMTRKEIIQIAPSILAGDFAHLADEAKRLEDAGADCIHLDIMDGNFVPNLTFGPKIVAAINRSTSLFLDAHIMVYNPMAYIEPLVEAGADRITFHFEATEDVEFTIEYIRKCGVLAGVAFSPETTGSLMPKYLGLCDYILVMTVEPGFGGQAFMPEAVEKVAFLRDLCNKLRIVKGGKSLPEDRDIKNEAPFDIGVDGGINFKTAAECAKAGANVFVAGTFLFGQPDLGKGMKEMRDIAASELKI